MSRSSGRVNGPTRSRAHACAHSHPLAARRPPLAAGPACPGPTSEICVSSSTDALRDVSGQPPLSLYHAESWNRARRRLHVPGATLRTAAPRPPRPPRPLGLTPSRPHRSPNADAGPRPAVASRHWDTDAPRTFRRRQAPWTRPCRATMHARPHAPAPPDLPRVEADGACSARNEAARRRGREAARRTRNFGSRRRLLS